MTVIKALPVRTLPPSRPRSHALSWLVWSDSPRALLWRRALTVLAIVLGLVSTRPAIDSLSSIDIYSKDLVQEYVLARALLDRVDPYVSVASLAHRYLDVPLSSTASPLPSAHPPTAGLVFLPSVLIGYRTLATVWLVIEVVFLVVAVRLLGAATGHRLSLLAALAWSAGLLAWHSVQTDLFWGQLSLAQLCLVAGAAASFRSGRDLTAGLLLGLGILLKPLLVPLALVLLLCHRWRALAGLTLVVATGHAVVTWTIGLEAVISYFTHALPVTTEAYRGYIGNRSLWSLVWRVFAGTGSSIVPGMQAPPLVDALALIPLVSVTLVAVVLVPTCLRLWRTRSVHEGLGLMLCVSLLASPISWTHYWVLLLLPSAQVISWLRNASWPRAPTNAALAVALALLPNPDVWGVLGFAVGTAVSDSAARAIAIASVTGLLVPLLGVGTLGLLVRGAPSVASLSTPRLLWRSAKD